MRTHFHKHRAAFVVVLSCLLLTAAALPLVSASCSTQRHAGDDAVAVEKLRVLARGATLPPESVVAGLASEYASTRAGALARILQARIRAAAGDQAGAATLLDSRDIAAHTTIADYALFMRGEALEKANRRAEARAAYEQLARDYPGSLRAREATLRAAQALMQDGQASGVPVALRKLTEADDAEALLLAARAHEAAGNSTGALGLYRRLYFYAPVSATNDAEAAAAFTRLNSSTAPATLEEASTRAEKLYRAKRYADAAAAYADAFGRFPATATPEAQLRRGIAAYNARRGPETITALSAVPLSSGDTRAEALHYLVQHYARARQWDAARSTADEMRRAFPSNAWTMRALVAAGQSARDAKSLSDALYFNRLAVQTFPGAPEVAGAQFELAWAAHDANNFQESSRLLIEHLANYADRNTDNRGRAGYWAARDSERAGRLAEARALYQAMLVRYDANWYGYLSQQRLDALAKSGVSLPLAKFAGDSPVGRAVANLQPVAVADETAGLAERERIARADDLNVVGLDDLAHAELDRALEAAPASPSVSLAKARIYRRRDDNVQAFNVLRKSFPDYSQMEPEELTTDEWDVFYPLAHWNTIVEQSRSKGLDPYTVAGLIRQESVFNPRAASTANAYGLMQLLVPTARMMVRSSGVERDITVEALFEPRLNIQLGTSYLRNNMDKFGRIEYVAAAYNAGPGRAAAWRTSLPLQMDEWAEAIPFKETRGYVQGVVRNMLQYRRLYDEQGRFRPEVGTRAARNGPQANTPAQPNNNRPRRVSSNEEEE
ncbi:MAG TPA: transglycosylase SLT domain-containing protein [Pyrinomonadaceae bacterium]|nr:transglycosylase SLT domain-containing protein [Pyrinomonadaceae bacterium]